MPHPDCGEPTIIKLADNAIITLLNSQWWLSDWQKHTRTNEGCEIKSRSQAALAFEATLRKYKNRRLIFALHHPLESLGQFGGHFQPIEHLKPPLVGSLEIWAKQSGLIPQYRNHPKYNALSSSLQGFLKKYGSFIFLSGHERNLQLFKVGKQIQIISGASSTHTSPAKATGTDEFTTQTPGWVELNLRKETSYARFISGVDATQLFKIALPPVQKVANETHVPAPAVPSNPITSKFTKRNFSQTNPFTQFFLGEHYRDTYTLEMPFEPLNLELEQGGLTPIKIGGGTETNSLRLLDKDGAQWVVRSTTKDSSRWRWLPYPLNELPLLTTVLEDLLFTATHPAAATTISPMAEALGLYHSQPRLMYLPDQIGLREYRGYITNEVVLFERRAKKPKKGILPANLAGTPPANLAGTSTTAKTKYRSTPQMLQKIIENPDKHQIDQEMMLKAPFIRYFSGRLGPTRRPMAFCRHKTVQ